MNVASKAIAIFCLTVMSPLLVDSADAACTFSSWFEFKGTKIFRNPGKTAYVYTTAHSRIDADGAPNAYHPDDVGKNCISDSHIGLDCPANAGYPNTSWWPSVLVPDPANPAKPFVQPSGAFKGFFIAATWLADPLLPATDAKRFVDSTTIPYLVFPGSSFALLAGTGSKGDVGIAWHTQTGKSTAFIVADQGGGSNINPRTGSGVAPGKVRFVVFPGSRKSVPKPWPRTVASIKAQADTLLEEIGGQAAVKDCN
jgi:hypothetical protein